MLDTKSEIESCTYVVVSETAVYICLLMVSVVSCTTQKSVKKAYNKKDYEKLYEYTKSDDVGVKNDAFKYFYQTNNNAALKYLFKIARENSGETYGSAVEAISSFDSRKTVEFLLNQLREAPIEKKVILISNLGSKIDNDKVRERVVSFLGSKEPPLELTCAEVLARAGYNKGKDVAATYTHSDYLLHKKKAINILGLFEDREYVKYIKPHLESDEKVIASAADKALKRILGRNYRNRLAGNNESDSTRSDRPTDTVSRRTRSRRDNRQKTRKRYPLIDRQVPSTEMNRSRDIAVVIGVSNYTASDIPDVEFALRDAKVMRKYLIRTLGFREENIIYEEDASGAVLERIFGTSTDPEGQLHDWARPNESNVFVYYSGHGAPDPGTGNAYLVPSDADPNYLSQNGYPVSQLYENLSKVQAGSVTVLLESCFSGVSEGGAVVQEASPVKLSVENPVVAMENGLAFTAGAADQVASWYSEKKHGLFTYYFLRGLRGNADKNGDREVTAREIGEYLTGKVPYRAQRIHGREQTPQVTGQTKDRVLVRYKEGNLPAQK